MTATTAPFGLAELIAPRAVRRFLDEDWLLQSLCTHGATGCVAALRAIPALASVESLIAGEHECLLTVNGTGAQRRVAEIDREEALRRRAAGELGSLTVVQAQQGIPELRAILARLWRDLGTPQLRATCNAYFSIQGSGIQPHFDDHETIVVMLYGRKEFTLAPNHVLRWPIRPDVLLPDAWEGDGRPADAESHVLAPGSVLIMPRGTWHATRALEECLSLTFAMGSASWLELVLKHLKNSLKEREAWRRPPRSLAAAPELTALLRELEADLRGLSTPALLRQLVIEDMRRENALSTARDRTPAQSRRLPEPED